MSSKPTKIINQISLLAFGTLLIFSCASDIKRKINLEKSNLETQNPFPNQNDIPSKGIDNYYEDLKKSINVNKNDSNININIDFNKPTENNIFNSIIDLFYSSIDFIISIHIELLNNFYNTFNILFIIIYSIIIYFIIK